LLYGLPGIAAIAIAIWMTRIKRFSRHWLVALFFRERLRQWHFQKFLDGSLIEQLIENPAAGAALLDAKWADFLHRAATAEGEMNIFMEESGPGDWFFVPSPYSNDALLKTVFETLRHLRLDYQLVYTAGKRQDRNRGLIAMRDASGILEYFAWFTLFVAVSLSVGQLIVSVIAIIGGFNASGWFQGLAYASTLLGVSSAGVRALRNGLTLPEEDNSYAAYKNRLREIQVRLNHIKPAHWHAIFEYVERESIAELRRFLRMKDRASFLV